MSGGGKKISERGRENTSKSMGRKGGGAEGMNCEITLSGQANITEGYVAKTQRRICEGSTGYKLNTTAAKVQGLTMTIFRLGLATPHRRQLKPRLA